MCACLLIQTLQFRLGRALFWYISMFYSSEHKLRLVELLLFRLSDGYWCNCVYCINPSVSTILVSSAFWHPVLLKKIFLEGVSKPVCDQGMVLFQERITWKKIFIAGNLSVAPNADSLCKHLIPLFEECSCSDAFWTLTSILFVMKLSLFHWNHAITVRRGA